MKQTVESQEKICVSADFKVPNVMIFSLWIESFTRLFYPESVIKLKTRRQNLTFKN